jgi:hypothetical protein
MIQPAKRNGRGLATSNTRMLTNNTLLSFNSSRSVNTIGIHRNFSSSAPVTADNDNNRRNSVDSTNSSTSYNGSNPELLYDRSDKLQERAVNLSIGQKNLESYEELTKKYDNNPASLTTDERSTLENIKRQMLDFDKDKSLTDNLNHEVKVISERVSHLQEKHLAKQDKANTIVENSMDPVSPNKPTDNQTPTEFVHELESTSPMHIIPDDE